MVRKGEIGLRQIKRDWPHHVALRAEDLRGPANSMPKHVLAKELEAAPMPYHLNRDDGEFVVFCFLTVEAAQTFAERFGGELMPVVEDKPGRRRRR
jgi:hypothetical protein